MGLYVKRDLYSNDEIQKSANYILLSEAASFDPNKNYDIFMSHSYKDKRYIFKLKRDIESMGYSVYVDWIDDSQLDRTNVTKETAELIRHRMKNCKSLFFVTSENTSTSKWMPWELGYFDGLKDKVAILPLADEPSYSYKGQEYLSLYPYVMKDMIQGTNKNALWIHDDRDKYIILEAWLNGSKPRYRAG